MKAELAAQGEKKLKKHYLCIFVEKQKPRWAPKNRIPQIGNCVRNKFQHRFDGQIGRQNRPKCERNDGDKAAGRPPKIEELQSQSFRSCGCFFHLLRDSSNSCIRRTIFHVSVLPLQFRIKTEDSVAGKVMKTGKAIISGDGGMQKVIKCLSKFTKLIMLNCLVMVKSGFSCDTDL